MSNLEGRVALVTGSARRLGRTIALGLAGLGATVAVHYRHSEAEALEVVARIEAAGGRAAAFRADVEDDEACRGLVEAVATRFGALHVLVNNVGDYRQVPLLQETPAGWRSMFDSNLHSAFAMCHHALPVLRQQDYGRIINLGFAQPDAARAVTLNTAYAIAKHGVLALTRSLAVALADAPITVNLVAPGTLEDAVAAPPLSRIPKARWGREDEVWSAIAYLLSREADYVTGQQLQVAGGFGL